MNASNQQQVLNLQLTPANTFDSFYPGTDQTLISVLKSVASGILLEPQIFLWGMAKTGKTHVLQAMCHVATSSQKRVMYMPMELLSSQDPCNMSELHDIDIVCIDNVHVIAKYSEWESALFNFINHQRDQETVLVFSSESSPAENLFELPDLNSRTLWGPVYKLNALLDEDLDIALQLHAKSRGLDISIEVQNYLLTHYKRDISSIVDMLEKLDQASLQEKRRVTIPFLKKVIT